MKLSGGCACDEASQTHLDSVDFPKANLGIRAYRIGNTFGVDTILPFANVDSLKTFFGDEQWWPDAILPSDCQPIFVSTKESGSNTVIIPENQRNDTLLVSVLYPGSKNNGTYSCPMIDSTRTHEQIYCWTGATIPSHIQRQEMEFKPDWACNATSFSIDSLIWHAPDSLSY